MTAPSISAASITSGWGSPDIHRKEIGWCLMHREQSAEYRHSTGEVKRMLLSSQSPFREMIRCGSHHIGFVIWRLTQSILSPVSLSLPTL